jgi:tetratricopeptide (TPR) repeat protein
MRIVSTLALAIALGGTIAATPAFAAKKDDKAAAPAQKYTPAVQKALIAAQDALKKDDTATATAKLAEAKAAGLQTADDKYMTGSMEYQLYQKTKDEATLGDAVELMVSSGSASGPTLAQLQSIQASFAYKAKDYVKAANSATEALKNGSTEPSLVPIMIESLQNQGKTVEALTALNGYIDKAAAAGQPAPLEWFQRGMETAFHPNAGADVEAVRTQASAVMSKLAASYPTKQNWRAVGINEIILYKMPTDQKVDMFRLLRAADGLLSDSDYREYAAGVYLAYPGEAAAILKEGNAKGVVNLSGKNEATDLLGIVNGKTTADKASLAASDKSARNAADSKAALTTADAYVTYGMYPQAIDLYKVALAKGADAGTVNLHTGWALALSGDAAGAKAAFGQVTGPRKPIAELWIAHLNHPTQG